MKWLIEMSCWLYDRLIHLHADSLQYRYGEQMQVVFRDLMEDAASQGLGAVAQVWASVASELLGLLWPVYAARAGVLAASVAGSTAIIFTAAMGFCTLGPVIAVHGYSWMPVENPEPGLRERMVETPDGHKTFLRCKEPKTIHGISTVILATGRGVGDHTAWVPVQEAVSAFDRVCSYEPLGVGLSDKVPFASDQDELVGQMHALFEAAQLPKPYVLVGTSAGGVLVRRYESRYPAEVGGFVFADSSHEEMEWRDAAIAESFDLDWNNAKTLHDNGMLPKGKLLDWHDDVPMVVLERGERAPCEAFPGLTPAQCNGMNDAWHSFQVDLSHRSTYAQLRIVDGAGHRMIAEKPDAVAQAVHDVVDQMNQLKRANP